MEKLLNLIFPPRCVFCNTLGSAFCRGCLAKARSVFTTRRVGDSLDVFVCYAYEGVVRDCIKYAKYSARRFAALRVLAREGTARLRSDYSDFVIVPIPLSVFKLKRRGFNQAELIARELACAFGSCCASRVLIRSRDTAAQYALGKGARRKNVEGAFAVESPGKVCGRKVLLVDDICTTGATLCAGAQALLEAGALEVYGFVLSGKL